MGVDDIRILCIILAIITIYLLLRYRNLRRELTSVSKQVEALVSDETEKMIDIVFVDKELERLAGLLNEYNEKQRMVVAGAMRNEEYLKDSVANISHDLRTPLTVILGHLQLLDTQALPPEQAERIAIVRNKAERMKELVETFYEYSLLHTSGKELKTERINVTNLMINLITENAPAMEEKNLEPEIHLADLGSFHIVNRYISHLLYPPLAFPYEFFLTASLIVTRPFLGPGTAPLKRRRFFSASTLTTSRFLTVACLPPI